ncbi:LuxR C-terminal-related transcriptional regulator, partial [Streptomyces hirsutus]|uniref:LuxR C-terminal-related transcriptional regulator n=1 Tax=Streptomyces hirsutus TaxID=35620 RepID=UPI00331ED29C
ITVGTVKTHLGNIQGKLAVRNRVEIAAWAWRVPPGHRGRRNLERIRSWGSRSVRISP